MANPDHDDTTPTQGPERPWPGSVRLRLGGEAGRIVRVTVENGRLTGPFPMICGQDTETAVERLATLFPICGLAHRHVGGAAIAAAQGRDAQCTPEVASELMAEFALSQVWRAAVDWPRVVDAPPRVGLLKTARGALSGSGVDAEALALALAGSVFDNAPPEPGALTGWLEQAHCAGARMWRRARGMALSEELPPSLGARDAMWFGQRLLDDPAFAARPEAETGPADLSRAAGAAADGPLANRIAGLHVQALETLAMLETGQGICPDAVALGPGQGAAVVSTARGPLACLVECARGRVTDLRLSAPSEWALHPEGALVRLIRGVPVEQAAERAVLAVAACDPCAEVEIVQEAA